jgi:putative transposase
LVQPSRAVVAGIDHDGGSILRRDAGGCFGSSRPAGHFNTDQGSQFTGAAFTGVLANNDIAISMDGKGAWRDNVFVERLWRSVKYEEVHLRAYDSVGEARASIGRYLDFYNAGDRIRALAARHPIKPTSPRCQSGWQPNPGRRSTYRRGKYVHTTGTTSA